MKHTQLFKQPPFKGFSDILWGLLKFTPSGKPTMAMENGPVEDVFPTDNGDFPASHVSLLEWNLFGGFTPFEKISVQLDHFPK